MRSFRLAILVTALSLCAVNAARADTLLDWLTALLGFPTSVSGAPSGPQPDSGGGDGSDQQ